MKFLNRNIVTQDQRGFSLIEIMIVIVILGLLASFVAPEFMKDLKKAERQTAKTQIEMLMAALDSYRLDVGRYPSQQEGLEALISNPGSERWDGPYLKKNKIPKDPWDRDFHYQNPGDHGEVDIFTYGLDDQPGGEKEDKDVGSWQ